MKKTTLSEAQRICREIEYKYKSSIRQVHWNEVYNTEEEIVQDLMKIVIPNNRAAPPPYTFGGYEPIYSFAYYVQRGWKLSEAQIRQCKRLATEIKKAAKIGEVI